jgi:hypothetical protein
MNICLPAWKLSLYFISNSGDKYCQRGSQTIVVRYTVIMSYGILLKLNLIKALSWVPYSTDYWKTFIALCIAGILMDHSQPEANACFRPPAQTLIIIIYIYISNMLPETTDYWSFYFECLKLLHNILSKCCSFQVEVFYSH